MEAGESGVLATAAGFVLLGFAAWSLGITEDSSRGRRRIGWAGAFLAVYQLRAGHFWVYLVACLPCWMLLVWLTIVAMHTLGAYFYPRRDRLGWRRQPPWWEMR